MMKTFETEEDIRREKKAITTFVNVFGGSFQKLDPRDIDYKIFDKDNNLIAYAEVVGRLKTMKTAYPLPVSLIKLSKLIEKRLNPLLIWSCDDGVIYAIADNLNGSVSKPATGDLMVYYDIQKGLKYIRYT
jgi:hypothetical protein